MTVRVLVTDDRPDSYVGKRGAVNQQIINCMDFSKDGDRLVQPIEYAMSEDEKLKHAGKLRDKFITLSIRELLPFGGRLRCRGRILEVETK